jgi:tetratricopeptide (TPR) repeat protein
VILVSREPLTASAGYSWTRVVRQVPVDRGLDPPSFTRFLRHLDRNAEVVPAHTPDRLLSRVRRMTDGNPRLAELIFAYASREYLSLKDVADGLRSLHPQRVPAVVHELAVRSLDSPARQVLQAVSAFGTPIDENGVRDVLPDGLRRRAGAVLRSLVRRGFVYTAAGLFYMRSTEQRRVLDAMARQERLKLLENAADVLVKRQPGDEAKKLEDVDSYLVEANLRIAAGNYTDAYEAIISVQSVLTKFNRIGLVLRQREALREVLPDEQRMANLSELARIYNALGRSAEAAAACREGRSLAKRMSLAGHVQTFDLHLGTVAFDNYQTDEAHGLYEQARADAADDAARSEPLEGMARCLQRWGRLGEALLLLEEAIAAAPDDDRVRLAKLRLRAGRWQADAGSLRDALATVNEVGGSSAARDDGSVYAAYLNARADLLIDSDDPDAAAAAAASADAAARAVQEAQVIGDPVVLDQARVTLAHTHLVAGRAKRALQEIELVDRTRPRGRNLLVLALRAVAESRRDPGAAGDLFLRLHAEADERLRRDPLDFAAHQMAGAGLAWGYLDGDPIDRPREAFERANEIPAPLGQRVRLRRVLSLLETPDNAERLRAILEIVGPESLTSA